MLEIKRLSWSNFMSYGDYISEIDFTNLDQCLITGEIVDDDSKELHDDSGLVQVRRSNGAGKSNITSALQWTLFGRTMHSPNPGDKVVNYFTGNDCFGKVEFKNGDSITRVRRKDGQNEIIVMRNGDEESLLSNTVSTSKNQQARLAKEFNLDWDVFCGSVFFNQYGRPWMEMADQYRKKAIERVLHVDRFSYYSKVAKTKLEGLERDTETKRNRIADLQSELTRINNSIQTTQAAADAFEANQQQRQAELLREAITEKQSRDAIVLPNLTALKQRWDTVRSIEHRINDLRIQINKLNTAIAEHTGTVNSIKERIKTWTEMAGKICSECEQTIQNDHTKSKIEPLHDRVDQLVTEIERLGSEKEKQQTLINTVLSTLAEKKPNMTLQDADSIHRAWHTHDAAIKRLKQNATNITHEDNPHHTTIEQYQARRTSCQAEIQKLEQAIERNNLQENHYSYIYKAYNDRSKIKSYVFQDHIPFINNRLRHYLDVFGLDVQLQLTASLGIQSNLWGYDFESGGERKRTDVAFMLAMFDFHEQTYGRQCNILILDEVDGRLDDDGVEALINIIKNDLASKVEAVLIISHKPNMFDVFPSQIEVVRENRFSHIRQRR